MRKGLILFKRLAALILVLLFSINSFAALVGDNDGAAFITKAEFDSMKNNFQSQLDRYNSSIDNKIDGAIASYLKGIKIDKHENRSNEMLTIPNDGYIYSVLTKDLGMTAGYPDILINLCFSFGTKQFGGSYLAWRSGGYGALYTKSISSSDYSNRLYYRVYDGYKIFDGYWKVNEYFSGIIGVNKVDFDAGFSISSSEYEHLYCWASHNTKGVNLAVNTWWKNLWTKWGPNEAGTAPWQTYYVVDFTNINMLTNKFKPVYQATFLYDYDDVNKYPCWNDDNLNSTVIEPEYSTQDSNNIRIISNTVDNLWDKATKTQSWTQSGTDHSGYNIFQQPTTIHSSTDARNFNGRSGYTDRMTCVRTPDMIKISEFAQNDTRVLEWYNSDGTKGTLQYYSLSAGVPVTSVKIDDGFEWTPKIINMSTGSTANIDIEFYYGPYNGSQFNRVTNVTKDSKGKYKFEAREGAMIFARWQNGYAIDLANSNELYVTTS